MSKGRDLHAEIDWSSASVRDGRLMVGFAAEPASAWSDLLGEIVDRLQRPGSGYGAIKVKRKQVRVARVASGSEDELRLILEGAVLQANTYFASGEDDEGGDERRSQADEEMTAAFRGFAGEPDDDDG